MYTYKKSDYLLNKEGIVDVQGVFFHWASPQKCQPVSNQFQKKFKISRLAPHKSALVSLPYSYNL